MARPKIAMPEPAAADTGREQLLDIRAVGVDPARFQPRDVPQGMEVDPGKVREITDSYRPEEFDAILVVRDPQQPGRYIVVAGHHRRAAAIALDATGKFATPGKIPARVIDADISTPEGLAKAQDTAARTNVTVAGLTSQEFISRIRALRERGANYRAITNEIRTLRGRNRDNHIWLSYLPDHAVERVLYYPDMFAVGVEAGRAMEKHGMSSADASNLVDLYINKLQNGEKPPSSGFLRDALDKAFAKSQILHDQKKYGDKAGGFLIDQQYMDASIGELDDALGYTINMSEIIADADAAATATRETNAMRARMTACEKIATEMGVDVSDLRRQVDDVVKRRRADTRAEIEANTERLREEAASVKKDAAPTVVTPEPIAIASADAPVKEGSGPYAAVDFFGNVQTMPVMDDGRPQDEDAPAPAPAEMPTAAMPMAMPAAPPEPPPALAIEPEPPPEPPVRSGVLTTASENVPKPRLWAWMPDITDSAPEPEDDSVSVPAGTLTTEPGGFGEMPLAAVFTGDDKEIAAAAKDGKVTQMELENIVPDVPENATPEQCSLAARNATQAAIAAERVASAAEQDKADAERELAALTAKSGLPPPEQLPPQANTLRLMPDGDQIRVYARQTPTPTDFAARFDDRESDRFAEPPAAPGPSEPPPDSFMPEDTSAGPEWQTASQLPSAAPPSVVMKPPSARWQDMPETQRLESIDRYNELLARIAAADRAIAGAEIVMRRAESVAHEARACRQQAVATHGIRPTPVAIVPKPAAIKEYAATPREDRNRPATIARDIERTTRARKGRTHKDPFARKNDIPGWARRRR